MINKFTMNYKDLQNFISLLKKHNIDLNSDKAKMLFESYKKVIQ